MQPKSIILFFYGYILFFRRHNERYFIYTNEKQEYKLQIEVILNTKENFLSIIKLKRFKYEEKIL